MKYQYCINDNTKMNRLFYQEAKLNDKGLKTGTKQYLDYFYCKTCMKIYKIDSISIPVMIPKMEIKN